MDDSKLWVVCASKQPIYFGGTMENELYLCSVDKGYLKYLHGLDYRVSVKYNNRPFVGIITMINGIKYVIPLTSQTTQEREKEGKSKRAARITTFVRDSAGVEIADLLYNNMIPITDQYYTLVSVNAEIDTYEANEIRFIRKNKDNITRKARKVHDDRMTKHDKFLYKTCCDFSKLEEYYEKYQSTEK